MGHKKKAINGIIWTSLELIFGKGIGVISTIIIARILSPQDYGIIGMTTLFVGLTSTLIDSGMTQSLIRKKNVSPLEYSSVFYLNLILSILFAGILCLLSPYIAIFYKVPILSKIIQVYALCIIINTIRGIQITLLTKEMNFKQITLINIPSSILGFIFGIWFAYNHYGVWSLVYMTLITSFATTFLFWLFGKRILILKFSFKAIKTHFHFGYKLTFSSILHTIYENVNNILIGKFYPVQKLGLYERSYYFNNYPITMFTDIIARVTYPLISQFHDDYIKLKLVFRKILISVFFVSTPFFFIISGISTPLFNLILGDKWVEVVIYYKILSLGFILYPIHILHLNLITAMGRSELFLKLEIIKKILGISFTIIFFQFGIMGLIWGFTIMSYIALFINTFYTRKILNYTYKEQFFDLFLTYLTACIAGIIAYYLCIFFSRYSLILNIMLSFLISFAVFIILNLLFKNKGINNLKELLIKNEIK